MIRLALDRSAVESGAAFTGIARYIHDLAHELRRSEGIDLIEDNEFNLCSGLRAPGGAAGGIGGALREYMRLSPRLRRGGIDVYHAPASRAPGRRLPIPVVVT